MKEENKREQLNLYRDLNLAVMNYLFEKFPPQNEPTNFDAKGYFKRLRLETQKLHDNGDFATLKKWFTDYISIAEERGDVQLKKYVEAKTGCDIDKLTR